jgi:branched-chain amino acid transport system ATP-binding protein
VVRRTRLVTDVGELLAAAELRAGYGKTQVVHGVDIKVAAGEIVALLGPNGAGKTTTLLTIAGILPPLGGTVTWCGRTAQGPFWQRAREGLHFVAERSVIGQLTTDANLRLGRGDPEVAYAAFPELSTLRNRRAALLSGGEQRMVAMARAVASRPLALLLDELSLGLAPLVVERLFVKAKEIAARGVGVILVEQQAPRALEVADRGYVLQRGRVVMEGSNRYLVDNLKRLEESYVTSRPAERENSLHPHATQKDAGVPELNGKHPGHR